MTQYEFLQLTMQITQLCSSGEYRKALQLARQRGPERLAKADRNSEEHAALRLLIGTWNRIAIVCGAMSAKQRQEFFKSHPVSLVWKSLEPGIKVIRGYTDGTFAKEFEDLHNEYQKLSQGRSGMSYRSPQQQAVHALFFA